MVIKIETNCFSCRVSLELHLQLTDQIRWVKLAQKVNNLQQDVDKNAHAYMRRQKCWRQNWNAVSSGELHLYASINSKCCTGARHGRNRGHDSIVTATNELLTRESGDQILFSLRVNVCSEYINQWVEKQTNIKLARGICWAQPGFCRLSQNIAWVDKHYIMSPTILELG